MNCPEVYVPNINDDDDSSVLQPKAHLTFEFSLTSRRVLSIHYRCDDQNDDLKKECVEVDQVGEVSPTDPPLP